jgi:hypothetical protein
MRITTDVDCLRLVAPFDDDMSWTKVGLPSGEDCLGDHAVDALGAIHDLSDVIIHRDARDYVGFLAARTSALSW